MVSELCSFLFMCRTAARGVGRLVYLEKGEKVGGGACTCTCTL